MKTQTYAPMELVEVVLAAIGVAAIWVAFFVVAVTL